MVQKREGPILVPVDFSEDSRAAIKAAIPLAGCLHANLIVLHVVHDPSNRPGFYKSLPAGNTVLRTMEEAAVEMMEMFLAENSVREEVEALGLTLTTQLIPGLPVTQILNAARQEEAAMIVMGSRGLTGVNRLLLGSKAERVVQLSPIPVMVVKAPKKDADEKGETE